MRPRQLMLIVGLAAAGCGNESRKASSDLDPEKLRQMPPAVACLQLSKKLTACQEPFIAALRSSFVARGQLPDHAVTAAAAFATPPDRRECATQPTGRIERILGCYSNTCVALAACVLNESLPARDTGPEAPRCPATAAAYRSASGKVRWCARPDGVAHGIWRAEREGTGVFVDGKRHGRFELRSTGRVEIYDHGRIVKVNGTDVAQMKSVDLDTAIALARVPRNTSAVSTEALRATLQRGAAPDLAACTDELRLRDRFGSGMALLILEIDGTGAVNSAAGQGFDAPLAQCLSTKAQRWCFDVPADSEPGTAWLLLSVSTVHVKD